jgi:hypothetical protein
MSTPIGTSPTPTAARKPLRLRLTDTTTQGVADGAWWPQSRDLQTEAADLVDHFPPAAGRISRLLFSRPDWDNSTVGDRGVRKIRAAGGPVKVGSFPHDDTHLMIATLANGQRLKLLVIPSTTGRTEGEQRLRLAGATNPPDDSGADWARWDNESPGT